MNLHYSKTSKEDWSCYQCMYHRVFNYILLYHVPFFRKNILTTIFVQVCSTTLRFCTSSDPQRDIWSCYRHKMHAITLLQNRNAFLWYKETVLLPYEFTLLQNNSYVVFIFCVEFYCPMNLHYSKTSKEDIWSCYQCMYHRTFNCILSYRLPFVKNILTTIFV